MPYKYFEPNVLQAGDVNQYLMNQSVMVFDDATARDNALTSPTEGMIVYLKDSNLLLSYDGSQWVRVVVLDSANRYSFPSSITVTTETGTNRGIGVRASSGNVLDPIVQFTDNAAAIQRATISANSSNALSLSAAGGVDISGNLRVNGRVESPNQPSFLADRSTNVSYQAAGFVTPVVFNRTYYNYGSAYNTATGFFTAPTTGTYMFNAGVYQSAAIQQLWFVVNGNRERSFVLDHTAASGNMAGSGMVRLGAGDTVGVVSWSGGSTVTIYTNFFHTYFRGALVG